MVTGRVNSTVFYATLAAVLSTTPSGECFAKGQDDDLVRRITKALPPGWSVDISSFQGKCFVNITTAPLETQASIYGQSFPGNRRMQLGVSMIILPCYTTEMLDRIKSYNKPVRDKLKTLGSYSE